MLVSIKNGDDLENLSDLVLLRSQVKSLRLQDKIGKQNFEEDMKKIIQPITDTVKQTAEETIGAVKDTIKATALREEETNKAINEIKNLIKFTADFELRLFEPLSEVANSKNT